MAGLKKGGIRVPKLGGGRRDVALLESPDGSSQLVSRQSVNGDLVARLKSGGQAGATQLMGRLKQEGDVERARRAAESRQEQLERRIEAEIAVMGKIYKLKLASVLDYTASTINDVHGFVQDLSRLLDMLRPNFPGGVDFLPVAVRGGGPEVLVGGVNDVGFYSGVGNVAYNWPTPIGYGMDEVVARTFYGKNAPLQGIQAVVGISDSNFEISAAHNSTIAALKNAGVAVASLTDAETQSHVDALRGLEDLAIVVDRRNPEMDSVALVYEFIMNIKGRALRPFAAAKVKAQMEKEDAANAALRARPAVGFAEHLRLKGHSREAGNVIEGRPVKRLT